MGIDSDRLSITIIGCGPGAFEYLTEAGRRAIRAAEVLVGSARLLDLHAAPGQETIVFGSDISGTLEQIERSLTRRAVAVLVSGDPGLCSLARPVLRRFGRETCRVIPGVSAVQAAFAAVGVDWLDAVILDAHHALPLTDTEALARREKIAVLGGHREALAWIVRLGGRLGNGYTVVVCEDLTMPGERIRIFEPGAPIDGPVASRTIVLFLRKELLS
ncbi:MAG: precorrin-6y C5,15-methyltransferase (decarboxylating) subunit CbiE [Desulfatitalea sp.]|nr:precorrin-6y C5,15-methyltransferase (decarboxylating) subunit CbiE [Desulfatitalea sp.]